LNFKRFIVLLAVFTFCIFVTSCEKEQYDNFTGKWESDYSIYNIKKINDKYSYTISDLDGKNSKTYENGVYSEDKKVVLFENKKWIDQFKYDKESKNLILTDIRDEEILEYKLTKIKEKSEN
jgi:hypothetical protein